MNGLIIQLVGGGLSSIHIDGEDDIYSIPSYDV